MDITCNNCKTKLRVADEKLPESGSIRLKCPSCAESITIELESTQSEDPSRAPLAPESPPAPQPAPFAPAHHGADSVPEFFAPDARVAFLYIRDTNWLKAARNFFNRLEFDISEANDSQTAAAKVRMNGYDVVVVEDDEQGRLLLAEINSRTGVSRQEINVVLIGQDPSRSPDAAFLHGVNYCINSQDGARVDNLLEEALLQYKTHYQPVKKARAGLE